MPQNHKRAVCDLTVADRLALYDHVVHVLGRQKEAVAAGNEDLYVDLVSKLQKGESRLAIVEERFKRTASSSSRGCAVRFTGEAVSIGVFVLHR